MLIQLEQQIRRHIIITNGVIIVLEIIIAALVWYFSGAKTAFQTTSNYTFLCASVVIASVAAVNSILASVIAHDSLKLTQDSLELTRATQRPFLTPTNLIITFAQTKSNLKAIVSNTGTLPAKNVSIDMTLHKIESADREIQVGNVRMVVSIAFPQTNHLLALTISDEVLEQYRTLAREGKLRTRVTTTYHHSMTGEIFQNVFVYDVSYVIATQEYYFNPNTALSS